jgi:SAM-dependent methyltransferase
MRREHGIHLTPRPYTALQDFVHRGHREVFEVLLALLNLQAGETVVELGCGTGTLTKHFVARGFDYWGLDLDPSRIAAARRLAPQAHLLVHDALDIRRAPLPAFRRAVIHGMLHHRDDEFCRGVIDGVLSLHPEMVLVLTEPYFPDPWWRNPAGALLATLDEGAHVRTLRAWRTLLAPCLDTLTTRSVWPRWPVGLIDVRLRARR